MVSEWSDLCLLKSRCVAVEETDAGEIIDSSSLAQTSCAKAKAPTSLLVGIKH